MAGPKLKRKQCMFIARVTVSRRSAYGYFSDFSLFPALPISCKVRRGSGCFPAWFYDAASCARALDDCQRRAGRLLKAKGAPCEVQEKAGGSAWRTPAGGGRSKDGIENGLRSFFRHEDR
jgi:hypothetical protein